jgi:hypothetical protein
LNAFSSPAMRAKACASFPRIGLGSGFLARSPARLQLGVGVAHDLGLITQ